MIRFLLALGLCCLFIQSNSFPAEIHIPIDQPTINAGITAASAGDVVVVHPGVYFENIDFQGKAITVKSLDGPDVTEINGSQNGCVVKFSSGETANSVLDGFEIRNGSGETVSTQRLGGGIFCWNTSPTIRNNKIKNNKLVLTGITETHGGGIACVGGAPLIECNQITSNNAYSDGPGLYFENSKPVISQNYINSNNSWYGSGGGICCKSSEAKIVNNNITGNTTGDGVGGGIFCSINPCLISNNKIENNKADSGGGIFCNQSDSTILLNFIFCNQGLSIDFLTGDGGGIYLSNSHAKILGNQIIFNNPNNTAPLSHGGGVMCYNSSPSIINNTIYGNKVSSSSGGYGGGVFCTMGSSPVIVNTILYFNKAHNGPELGIGGGANPSTISIDHCDLEGGNSAVYIELGGVLNMGAGMIDSNPLLLSPGYSDFHKSFNSPCRNAGRNNAVPSILLNDMDGNPRIADGTVDMGADEFYRYLYYSVTPFPVSTYNIKFIGDPGKGPVFLWVSLAKLNSPIHIVNYGDWHLGFPLLMQAGLGSIPSDGCLVLSCPNPLTSITFYLQALIENKLSNLLEVY